MSRRDHLDPYFPNIRRGVYNDYDNKHDRDDDFNELDDADYDEEFNHGLNARRYRRGSLRLPAGSGLGYDLRGYERGNLPDGHEHDNDHGHGYGYGYGYDNGYNIGAASDDVYAAEVSRLRADGGGGCGGADAGEDDELTVAEKQQSAESSNSAAGLLSGQTLAGVEEQPYQEKGKWGSLRAGKRRQQRKQSGFFAGDGGGGGFTLLPGGAAPMGAGLDADAAQDVTRDIPKGRIVSGAYLEEGQGPDMRIRHRGGDGGGPGMPIPEKGGNWDGSTVSAGSGSKTGSVAGPPFWKRPRWWIGMGIFIVVLAAIVVPVVVVMTRKHDNGVSRANDADKTDEDEDKPANLNLKGISRDSIPDSAKGTVLDPFSWYDTTDFNVTYTDETVGGLPLMGLNSTWDDTAQANEHVPPLNETFPYGSQPIRGVNLGGWLSLEPFIVPSLFDKYEPWEGIVDEWTLTRRLGSSANATLEKHYAKFITEQDFIDIRDAGLDHVRIQFSYWAIKTYSDEPYVSQISWRYLLRAIEYCRKHGLRVKLDLHGLVGSQNGWNHSGREGQINWLNGTDGAVNRNRSLEIHDSVSRFFAQDRYKNVVTIYGLVNEPLMLSLPIRDVLDWTTEVTRLVQGNNITAWVVFHDGFLNLSKWKKMLKEDDLPTKMMLDTHQYTIFNTGQIVMKHTDRVKLVCNDWYHMIQEINTTTDGWGPTMCGEWSQADTDCAKYLNNVGRGTRWEGTFSNTDSTQYCPTASDSNADDKGKSCDCTNANAPPAAYSPGYKKFLQTYAEAQMSAFETAQGWFYWTWRTESAAQWSYRTAWVNGYMPKKAYVPAFKCGDEVPDFGDLPEYY